MISFKLFVEAIHHAIVSASDSLMDKNEGLLDKYFEKPAVGAGKDKGALIPKIVKLEYPTLDDVGRKMLRHFAGTGKSSWMSCILLLQRRRRNKPRSSPFLCCFCSTPSVLRSKTLP